MSETPQTPPFVSVVMPTYNRADFLERCLPPLFDQSYPQDRYEIILVDDGSTDGTVDRANAIAARLMSNWGSTFRIIQKTNGGPASARNTGYRNSTADIIAFIDSDCVASHAWITDMVNALIASHASGVGGKIIGVASDGWVSQYIDVTGLMRQRVRNGHVDYLITANAAFYRNVLVKVGGFDERSRLVGGDDVDLCFRLQQADETLMAIDGASIQHYHRQSVFSLATMFFRYGKGNYALSSNWNNRRRPAVELLRHVGAILLAPFLVISQIYRKRISFWWLVVFWPLALIEHSAFIIGYLNAMRLKRQSESH